MSEKKGRASAWLRRDVAGRAHLMEDAGRRGMLVPADQELLNEARRNAGALQP
jgi:hypothetical protein